MEISSRARSTFLTATGVLVALLLVAVAARGSTSAGGGKARTPSDALLDVFFGLYLVALAGGAVMFVYLLLLHRKLKSKGQPTRGSLLAQLATLFVLAGLLALIVRRAPGLDRAKVIEPEEAIGQARSLPVTTSTITAPYDADASWPAILITAGLIVLAAGAWWFAGRARKGARGELGPELAVAVAQAVDESLDDLRAEPDPRRAVIAAYARLERVLASHGLPRKPAEAPFEYLGRMLAALSVGDKAARALTDLFERAKFSQHAVGPEMKDEAIAALETVRDELLVVRALAEQERAAAIEAQRERAAAQGGTQ